MAKQRVVVGLSGGVDSAVSAWLLKQQGFDVVGLFMKNWEDDDRPAASDDHRPVASDDDVPAASVDDRPSIQSDANSADPGYCSANIDFVDAAAVADVIGIEIEHVNFAAEYKDRVFAEFLREYQAGRTPNPDVLCNAEIKFKAFLDHALRLGAEKIATGHYARVREREGRFELLKGLDPAKDQSYFLHRLTQVQLSRTLFPVGELHKTEVRRMAQDIGLPNAKKKDSTGICFIGERPFREFLNRYLASTPGPMLDERGREVGRHMGLSFFTLGQRQGLGIGGVKGGMQQGEEGLHAPWFVAAKDLEHNVLRVVQGHEHPALLSPTLRADDCSWVAGHAPTQPAQLTVHSAQTLQTSHAPHLPHLPHTPNTPNTPNLPQTPYTLHTSETSETSQTPQTSRLLTAKTRYRQADASCRMQATADGFALAFETAQWAVTPGQSAVLYDGDVCLGGGVIAAADVLAPLSRVLPAVAPLRQRRRGHNPARVTRASA